MGKKFLLLVLLLAGILAVAYVLNQPESEA